MRPPDETKLHLFDARAEVPQRAHRRIKGQRCAAPFPIYRDPAGELLAAHATDEARSATVAHILSVAAGYAYAEIETMATMMSRVGFTGHATVCLSETVDAMYIDTTAYLTQSRCGRVVILSYRGTPPASLVTWLSDADVGSDSMRLAGETVAVHSGFYRNLRATRLAIIEELTTALRGRSLLDWKKKVDHPMQALYVTGHSLGGALAVLFALSLSARPEFRAIAARLRAVYTYGQPMTVGEPLPDGARDVSGRIFRHVLPRDIVPLLPPGGWGAFAHLGHEYRYETGQWQLQKKAVTQAVNVREIPRAMLTMLAPTKRGRTAQYTAAVHGPHHYISALRPAGLVTEFGDYAADATGVSDMKIGCALLPHAVALRRPLDVPDLVDDSGVLRAQLRFAVGAGRREPIPDQEIAFVSGGKVVTGESHFGDVEIAADDAIDHYGVYRTAEATSGDLRIAVEQEVRVIRPGTRPLLLFDATLGQAELSMLAKRRGPTAPEMLAVRMRPIRSCRAIRRNLRRAGLAPVVVDASAILDEGVALDVDENFDAVRLARVGARMRGAGFPVVAIVHGDDHTPRTVGFQALKPEQVTDDVRWTLGAPPVPRTFEARIEALTGAALIAGNRIEIELDNAKARHWLLDAIAQARQRIHFQVYMALDDGIGSQVEAALAAAGARGVTVRVNVDSLHGLEGSFGLRNPLLERLRARPGVDLRVIHPVTGAPSLEDIKQRDHRKIVIVDGTVALVGGRNLSHEYYSGFDEVKLNAQSLWREVPWLDAGARVKGPVVAELERTFLEAWTGAGGAPFEIRTPPPAGTTAARVVVHHGLRDASTLDTYVGLLDSAKSHVNAINGFPLVLEIQHAMLRAIRRGVRVRALLGNLTPTHDGTPFKGPWSEARVAATELVHSRLDSIIAAGGEAYIFAVAEKPNWQRGLGTVYPHVHAKMMTVDGRFASVGSANLDVTAGYWENELILVVEDPLITRALEARIDELIAASKRVHRDDPGWQQTAQRRQWMRHWPGVLSI